MSGFYTIEVEDAEFLQWLKRTEDSFKYMVSTMTDVAKVIMENTVPLTPRKTTRLGKSFKWTVIEDNSDMKVVEIEMSAIDPVTGYDYAMIQHTNTLFRHPRGGNAFYLREGINESKSGAFQMIEEDYLSLFSRGFIV